jgi:hypothetical protein
LKLYFLKSPKNLSKILRIFGAQKSKIFASFDFSGMQKSFTFLQALKIFVKNFQRSEMLSKFSILTQQKSMIFACVAFLQF